MTLKYKVVLVGPPAVGKTSLLYRFVKNEWQEDYLMTIGVQVLTKSIQFKNQDASLIVWDIGGQQRFKGLRQNFYMGTEGALLIFDLTRETTFKEMEAWLKEMNEVLERQIPFVLIGNKADLLKEKGRILNPNEAKLFAQSHDSIYIETSAKTGEMVESAFKKLAKLIAECKGHACEE